MLLSAYEMETYFALSHHIDGFFFSVSFHFSVSSIPSIVKRSIRIFNAFVNETTGLLDVVLLSILNKTEKFNLGQKKTFVRNIKTRTYFFHINSCVNIYGKMIFLIKIWVFLYHIHKNELDSR